MREKPDKQADPPAAEAITVTLTLDRWRLLRLVCGIQGLYYLVTGLWPLLHLLTGLRVFSATDLVSANYPTTMLLALTTLIGATQFLMALRSRPDGLAVGLGASTAAAFFLVEGRFRSGLHWAVYVDLVFEVLFCLALLATYVAARLADRQRR